MSGRHQFSPRKNSRRKFHFCPTQPASNRKNHIVHFNNPFTFILIRIKTFNAFYFNMLPEGLNFPSYWVKICVDGCMKEMPNLSERKVRSYYGNDLKAIIKPLRTDHNAAPNVTIIAKETWW